MDGTAPIAPVTAPASWYRDPSLWPRERTAIFARSWQFLGHVSALQNPGDYISDVIAGWPILAIRGEDNTIRAFHNVCRHRAGPLVGDAQGHCDKLIKCRYHGWSYMFDGRLRMARDFGVSADFDPRDYGLFPLRIDAVKAYGLTRVPAEELVAMRDHGVSATYLSGLTEAGYKGLTPAAMVDMRDHGVSASYINEVRSLGYANLTPAELTKLREHGVSAGFIGRANADGAHHTPDELIRLRDGGER
jgi:nitrite reductase/ring-hydroxylating ferredoxin subunit